MPFRLEGPSSRDDTELSLLGQTFSCRRCNFCCCSLVIPFSAKFTVSLCAEVRVLLLGREPSLQALLRCTTLVHCTYSGLSGVSMTSSERLSSTSRSAWLPLSNRFGILVRSGPAGGLIEGSTTASPFVAKGVSKARRLGTIVPCRWLRRWGLNPPGEGLPRSSSCRGRRGKGIH